MSDPRLKLTEPRIEAILNALRSGCTRRAAAGAGGVHHATFYRWMDADATLRDEVEKAEAQAEANFTAVVARASLDPKNWTAAAWWLERRKWQDYGRHERVDMTVDLRKEVERVAAEQGIDAEEVWAELREMGVSVPR